MSDNALQGKDRCPFHQALRVLSLTSGEGLRYRKVIDALTAAFHGKVAQLLSTVSERPNEQRAVGAYVSSKIFWERFEVAPRNDAALLERVLEGENPYDAALAWSLDHVQTALDLDGSLIASTQSDFERQILTELTTLLKAHSKKGPAVTPERQLILEMTGAFLIIASACELVEQLHLSQYGVPISLEVYENTLLSAEFQRIWMWLAENSQAVAGQLVFKDIVRESEPGISKRPLDPSRFELEQKSGQNGVFFEVIMRDPGRYSKPMQEILDGSNPGQESKVRCPALELFANSPVNDRRVNLVGAATQWFLLYAVLPAVRACRANHER